MMVKMLIVVYWVLTLHNLVHGYHRLEEEHITSISRSSSELVTNYKTTQHHNLVNYIIKTFFCKLSCTNTSISVSSSEEEQTLQQPHHTSGSIQLWYALSC
ncbi:hypothetical protein L798_09817 [Zootermopsis nevadensis]|uniref:Secreted protein n=1 Tax=Zootermopsis nevadensis TaxID=136037 RepID=A0A067QZM0_ZOONE|nr:hypothetical protein L798_09817 [Zootermopsis nevadensis]